MKITSKKIVGGLLAGIMIAAVGVVFATAQDDGTSDDTIPQENFWNMHHMKEHGLFNNNSTEHGFFFYDLTDEQQTEIDEIITNLRDQGATPSEIQAAIQEKLDEFGVLDQRLENEINQTENRLQILNREKELREKGYSWDEIKTIIQDEFGIDNNIPFDGHGMMMNRHDFARAPRCPDGFMPGEEFNQ